MRDEHMNARNDRMTGCKELEQQLNTCASALAHILKCTHMNQSDRENVQHCEQQFRTICNGRDEVFWFSIFSPTPCLRVSLSFERVWGREVEKLYQNPRLWVNAIHPDDRRHVEQAFDSWLKQKTRVGYEIQYRVVRPDKSIFWLCDSVSGLFDRDGLLFGTSGVVRMVPESTEYELKANI